MSTPPILAKNIQKTVTWLCDIDEMYNDVDEVDQKRALAILRAVLHTLRDVVPLENLAHFSAQLPIFIRGLLFEGWSPNKALISGHKKEYFLDNIANALTNYPEIDPEEAAIIVFDVLCRKIDPPEVEKVLRTFPASLRNLLTRGNFQ